MPYISENGQTRFVSQEEYNAYTAGQGLPTTPLRGGTANGNYKPAAGGTTTTINKPVSPGSLSNAERRALVLSQEKQVDAELSTIDSTLAQASTGKISLSAAQIAALESRQSALADAANQLSAGRPVTNGVLEGGRNAETILNPNTTNNSPGQVLPDTAARAAENNPVDDATSPVVTDVQPVPNPAAETQLVEDPAFQFPDEDEPVSALDAEAVDPALDEELQEPPTDDQVYEELAEPVDPDADPELLGGGGEEEEFSLVEEPEPVNEPELLGGGDEEELVQLSGPEDVDPDEDPFERSRQDAEDAFNDEGPTEVDLEVDPLSDEALAQQEEEQALNREILRNEDAQNAASEAAFREKAKQQATFQARYKQPGNRDWRVRLSLGPNANYLYNAGTPRGSGAGILAPLAATDGVIFPYTPSITTTYSANYEQYDLVHSNYRGVFYKNSRVGDINIRGTFTAQDTTEANYLLAVIHFFRSATKMFYGQDAERGTPPPVCLLNGLGQFQFSDHPVVISSFNYTTPTDVDYIRATNPNNYGVNLLNRRAAVASNPGGSSLAGLNRLLNAVQNGLSKGAIPNVPAPGTVNQSVNNTAGATYVPTKMEIDITLIPVQTRAQVSKQFSLKGFANGDLLKGGFW